MKKRSPVKNMKISWIIMGIGALLTLIGGYITRADPQFKISVLAIIGGIVVVFGIVYYLVTVKCPHCGHALAGYKPFPEECPKCHKSLED